MTLTGLALAKTVAVGLGIAATTGGVAYATGNLTGLTIALQHVPSWAHAHIVLSGLIKR